MWYFCIFIFGDYTQIMKGLLKPFLSLSSITILVVLAFALQTNKPVGTPATPPTVDGKLTETNLFPTKDPTKIAIK